MRRHSRLQGIIEHQMLAEVCGQQLAINAGQHLQGQGFLGFRQGMDAQFEFGEHGLAKEGAPNIVDLTVEDIGLHARIIAVALQQDGRSTRFR